MSDVTDRILFSIKKLNNLAAENTAFDDDFVMYINAALSDLNQLGIGPSEGFSIEGPDDFWDDFMDEGPQLDRVKNYIGRYVRLLFDPPGTSFGISMIQDQLNEQAQRLVYAQEDIEAEETA